jgi:hypothetical protein
MGGLCNKEASRVSSNSSLFDFNEEPRRSKSGRQEIEVTKGWSREE